MRILLYFNFKILTVIIIRTVQADLTNYFEFFWYKFHSISLCNMHNFQLTISTLYTFVSASEWLDKPAGKTTNCSFILHNSNGFTWSSSPPFIAPFRSLPLSCLPEVVHLHDPVLAFFAVLFRCFCSPLFFLTPNPLILPQSARSFLHFLFFDSFL